jgi:hypothetical protein
MGRKSTLPPFGQLPLPIPDYRHYVLGRDVVEIGARDREARMSQLPLDQIDRNALANEVGSVAMTKTVGVNALFDPGFCSEPG